MQQLSQKNNHPDTIVILRLDPMRWIGGMQFNGYRTCCWIPWSSHGMTEKLDTAGRQSSNCCTASIFLKDHALLAPQDGEPAPEV